MGADDRSRSTTSAGRRAASVVTTNPSRTVLLSGGSTPDGTSFHDIARSTSFTRRPSRTSRRSTGSYWVTAYPKTPAL